MQRRSKLFLTVFSVLAFTIQTLRAVPPDDTGVSRLQTGESRRPVRIAIGGFSTFGEPVILRQRSATLVDVLTTELSNDSGFELVERHEVERVLKETELALSVPGRGVDAVKIGKILRADWLLIGALQRMGQTNVVVVKVVDAQTGVIRDLAVVPLQEDYMKPAKMIATFLRNSAETVSQTKPRLFLGVGQFENLGITNRFPDFDKNLRAALERAYRGTRISMVERGNINALFNELRLNFSGLTEKPGKGQRGEPAFLLVDGMYQLVQDEEFKVSLLLRVQAVGAKPVHCSITEIPRKALEDKVIAAIGAGFTQIPTNSYPVTRKDEARVQFTHGKELSGLYRFFDGYAWMGGYHLSSNPQKRLENICAAINAFESALFLDPDYDEAKIYLAVCLDSPDINQPEIARDYFYEVFVGSTNEALVEFAQTNLAKFYSGRQDQSALARLEAQAATNGVLRAIKFRAEQFGKPVETLPVSERTLAEQTLESRRQRILAECEKDESGWNEGSTVFTYARLHREFDEIYAILNHNTNDARVFIDRLLPQLTQRCPSLEVYFLATYLVWAREASAVNRMRLEELLNLLAKQPGKLQKQRAAGRALLEGLTESCVSAGYYGIAQRAVKLFRLVANHQAPSTTSRRMDIYWAYCEREEGRWQTAQQAFEALGKMEMQLTSAGPWGKAPFYFQAEQAAYECRQHLGIDGPAPVPGPKPKEESPLQFSLPEPALIMGQAFVFACDGDSIWLGDGISHSVWNKSRVTPLEISPPDGVERNITCIAPGKTSVWFGTAGSGLIELDKTSKRTTLHRDSLFLPNITSLYLAGQRLWLGYGKGDAGGLGYLDLKSKKFFGMTPRLDSNSFLPFGFSTLKDSVQLPFEIPPRERVVGIGQSSPQEIWVAAQGGGIRRFSFVSNTWNLRGNEWNSFNNGIVNGRTLRFLSVTPAYVIYGGDDYGGNLGIHDRKRQQTRLVEIQKWLPEWEFDGYRFKGFLCAAVDGVHVWAGGEGFVALINLASTRVERLCDLRNGHVRVHGLEVDGTDLWVGAGDKLYRLPRNDLLAFSRQSIR